MVLLFLDGGQAYQLTATHGIKYNQAGNHAQGYQWFYQFVHRVLLSVFSTFCAL
jgi:hypothetical protein